MSTSGTRVSRSSRLGRDIVVVGGSSGALDALMQLAEGLPADYPGSIFIVSHVGPHPSLLPELLRGAGPLAVDHARHEETVRPGHIYVAPPDRHMTLNDGRIMLNQLAREHFTRPAIDPLFRSAAQAYGPRVVGIVLSGTGSDGVAGLVAIQAAGGLAVLQAPSDALFPEMPESVIRMVKVDHVLGGRALGGLLRRLIEAPPAVAPA